jgi:hypothetical protein
MAAYACGSTYTPKIGVWEYLDTRRGIYIDRSSFWLYGAGSRASCNAARVDPNRGHYNHLRRY